MLGLECSTICGREVDDDSDKRLEDFVMWIRRMENISWLDKLLMRKFSEE